MLLIHLSRCEFAREVNNAVQANKAKRIARPQHADVYAQVGAELIGILLKHSRQCAVCQADGGD